MLTGSYCAILNPVQPPLPPQFELRLRFGETEYRFEQDPFVLYPGEILEGAKGTDFTAGMTIKGTSKKGRHHGRYIFRFSSDFGKRA